MKRTNKILIGIILISLMLLGIGYASIQNVTLNIAGTATADPSQSSFIVKFTGSPEVSDSNKAIATITGDTNATINVEGLTASGDTVTVTYTVENASTDLSADLLVETTNSNEEYFTIEAELAKTSIVAGETTTLTVTVELIKTPISTTEISTIGIELTATPVQPGQEGTTGGTTTPTLNEYGFYYGVPYSADNNDKKISYVFFEDGSVFYYEDEKKIAEKAEGSCVYTEKSISLDGTILQVSEDGTEIGNDTATAVAELGVTVAKCGIWGHSDNNHPKWLVPLDATYTLANAVENDKTVYSAGEVLPACYNSQVGDIFTYGDYEYRYGQYFNILENIWVTDDLEWSALVLDNSKTEYGEIITDINGRNVDGLVCTYAGCTNLTTPPTIPNTVLYIPGAFYGCTSLVTSSEIPESVTNMFGTYYGCSSIEVAPKIPEGVTDLRSLFYECTSLTTAPVIPNGATDIRWIFYGCTNLKTYVGNQDGEGDFSSYTLPNGITSMKSVFYKCEYITEAPIIPNGVTEMSYTFYGCNSLTTAPIIPNGVTLMTSTFYECTSLTTAPIIPNGVTDMRWLFYSCTNLKTYEGNQDADGDFSDYVLPTGITSLQSVFNNCQFITVAPSIPNGVTILRYAFYGCINLTMMPTLPSGVTDLYMAFFTCTSLTTASKIPESVTNMVGTFAGCTSLTGTIQINTNKITNNDSDYENVENNCFGCFVGTEKAIVLKGTSENTAVLELLASTANNGNVTVE